MAPAALGGIIGPIGFGALATNVTYTPAWTLTAGLALIAAANHALRGPTAGRQHPVAVTVRRGQIGPPPIAVPLLLSRAIATV
jgi:hypothetical protein